MKFRDLTSGNVISILDIDTVTIKDGIVKSVSNPHYDAQCVTTPLKMVVDVEVSLDGDTKIFTMNEDAELVRSGALIITTIYSYLKNEVEKIKHEAEVTLSSVDKIKEKLNNANSLLNTFAGDNSAQKALEERISALETQIKAFIHNETDGNQTYNN